MNVILPVYGTQWTAPTLSNWRNDTLIGGNFLWNNAANLISQTIRWRTGPARVTVVTSNNLPISGAIVSISQIDHAFKIGGTFNPGMIIDTWNVNNTGYSTLAFTHFDGGGGDSGPISSGERDQIRNIYITGGINTWKNESCFLEGLWESVFHTGNGYLGEAKGPGLVAMDWLKNRVGKTWRGFDGHALHYPIGGIYINPPYGTSVQEYSDYWKNFHLPDIISGSANFGMTNWSIVNEITSSWYTGSPQYQDPLLISNLRYARSLWAGSVYINGFNSIFEVSQQAEYLETRGIHINEISQQWHRGNTAQTQQGYCDEVKAFNFLIDGSTISPRTFNISEYDNTFVDINDRATDTEYALRSCFANPACNSFCFFGLWEPTHWLPAKFGLWKRDMSLSTVGQKFRDLFYKEWWIENVTGITNNNGYYDFTGCYFGAYNITIVNSGNIITKRFEIAPNMSEVVAIVNNNGVISFGR